MPTRRAGLAEATQTLWPTDLAAAVAAVLQRAHQQAEVRRAGIQEAQARTEAARRAEERRVRDKARRWGVARSRLLEVVQAIDRELAREGGNLSMADAWSHPAELAAVEVQASVLGRPTRASLEIVVTDDLSLRVRIADTESRGPVLSLPTVAKAKADHFRDAVLTYLAYALVPYERPVRVCRRCGCTMALGGDR